MCASNLVMPHNNSSAAVDRTHGTNKYLPPAFSGHAVENNLNQSIRSNTPPRGLWGQSSDESDLNI